jgi:hypothetical protein
VCSSFFSITASVPHPGSNLERLCETKSRRIMQCGVDDNRKGCCGSHRRITQAPGQQGDHGAQIDAATAEQLIQRLVLFPGKDSKKRRAVFGR